MDTIVKNSNLIKLDFYIEYNNKVIIIEFNGQHYEWVKHFQTEEEFKQQQYRDEILRQYCKDKNYDLIEIPYYDIKNISSILDKYFN